MSKSKKFMKDNNYSIKFLFDTEMDASNSHIISVIPRTIIIDKEDSIIKEELEREIKLLLE